MHKSIFNLSESHLYSISCVHSVFDDMYTILSTVASLQQQHQTKSVNDISNNPEQFDKEILKNNINFASKYL